MVQTRSSSWFSITPPTPLPPRCKRSSSSATLVTAPRFILGAIVSCHPKTAQLQTQCRLTRRVRQSNHFPISHCSEEHLLQVQQHGVTSNIWRCNILVCRYSVTNDAFRHKLMWCCTSRLTSAVAFLPANSFLSVLCASRVLVLENGKMAEFDSPSNLISQRGAFHKMAKDSGLV